MRFIDHRILVGNLLQTHRVGGSLKGRGSSASIDRAGPRKQPTIKMLVWLLKDLRQKYREGEEELVQLAQPGARVPLLSFCHSLLVFRWR